MAHDAKPRVSMRALFDFIAAQWRPDARIAVGIALAMSLATLTEIFIPVQAGRLVDALGQGPAGRETAINAFVVMAALGGTMVVLRHFAWWGIVPFSTRLMRRIVNNGFAHVQRLSSDWHANAFAGSVVRKITRGMWAFDTLDDVVLLALVPSLTILVGSVTLMALKAPGLGLVMAIGAIVYIALTVTLATRWIAPASRLSNGWDTKIGGVLADAVGANAVVKAFAGEAREDARLDATTRRWQTRTHRTWMRHTWSGSGQLALLWAVRLAVTGQAVWLWWQGRASVGDVTYVITAYLVVHGYLRDIGQHVHHLQRALNEMEELVALHQVPESVADVPFAPALIVRRGEIAVEAVRFGYAGRGEPLFDGLDVQIPAGQRVGLVGASGSGKSSFVRLLQRLHDVQGGCIRIDGQNIAGVTQSSLRRALAIVPQEPILFHRSIAENIAYARPDATQAEIEAAAALANAHDFISAAPRGYRTLVGERGVKLSGGERQRVALARAFLADAPVLILDEATASLDSESEVLITQAMQRLMAGRTALIIAHRLATVRNLDRILVFRQGRIVEDGSHAELLARADGAYRRLFEHQSGKQPEIA
jgi:ATP-binding cassette, subfamily B, bacterial